MFLTDLETWLSSRHPLVWTVRSARAPFGEAAARPVGADLVAGNQARERLTRVTCQLTFGWGRLGCFTVGQGSGHYIGSPISGFISVQVHTRKRI